MSDETPNRQYSHMGHGERGERLSHRTASDSADFFLPHLKPEMRILDCGCGSGSITVGIAEAVSQGEVVGIDIGEAPVEHAKELAKERGISNVSFEVASVNEIPFEDVSFDAVFSHNVMEHLSNPDEALKEIYRVLKPGGVVGIADVDLDGTLLSPKDDPIREMFDLWLRVWEHNGGNPRIGKNLRGMLVTAGFSRVQAMSKGGAWGTEEELKSIGNRNLIGVFSTALETAAKLGWTDPSAKDRVEDEWETFATKPDAFLTAMQCQVIGWKE